MATYFAKPPKGALLNRSDRLAKGFVAAWLLNEGGGLTAYDSVGRSNGTLTNGPAQTHGVHGKALAFTSASSQYISVPAGVLDLTTPITVAGLIRTATNGKTIFGAYKPTSPFNGYAVGIGSGGTANVLNWWDGTAWRSASTNLLSNLWISWVVTASGSGTVFYVNGLQDASTAGAAVASYTGAKAIGAVADGSSSFFGDIGTVQIWRRVLSASEARSWCADPFRMFRRRSVPVPIRPAAAASGNRRRRVLIASS